ncbi:MAG: hypothetical protein HOK81_11720 [Rhodospirillaceae bacterium]|jgi:hypothetical protein|nr:hypothetical protein [Rhodospirillaceae bacterium]
MKKPAARKKAPSASSDATALARSHVGRAITRLAEIMEGDDDRLAAAACNAILERAFGRPTSANEPRRRGEPMEITVRWESDDK